MNKEPKIDYVLAVRLELLLNEKRRSQGDYVVFNCAEVCRMLDCTGEALLAAINYLKQKRVILYARREPFERDGAIHGPN